MRSKLCVALALVISCEAAPPVRPRPIPSLPVETTGAIARELLAAPGFSWSSFETAHFRIHLSSGVNPARIGAIADSVENARRITLDLVDEPDVDDEEPVELFLVETRDETRKLLGASVTGTGYPSELTAVVLASDGYRPFYRHELTRMYLAHRWGARRAGDWLDEGLAARATGTCQGQSIDAIAANYLRRGQAPSLDRLTGAAFDSLPETPAYFTAASLVDYFQRREGAAAVRALWRGEAKEVTPSEPLGPETSSIWSAWQRHLKKVKPASLSPNWLRQDGC